MSSNSSTIVQEIRQEFESILNYVGNAHDEIADGVERQLFKRLLGMGQQLMQLFFVIRGAESSRTSAGDANGNNCPTMERENGTISPYLARYRVNVHTFTRLGWWYAIGYRIEHRYRLLLDLMREMLEYVGVDVPYSSKVCLPTYSGQSVSQKCDSEHGGRRFPGCRGLRTRKHPLSQREEGQILTVQVDLARVCRWYVKH